MASLQAVNEGGQLLAIVFVSVPVSAFPCRLLFEGHDCRRRGKTLGVFLHGSSRNACPLTVHATFPVFCSPRLFLNARACMYFFLAVEYDLSLVFLELTLTRVVMSWIFSGLAVLVFPKSEFLSHSFLLSFHVACCLLSVGVGYCQQGFLLLSFASPGLSGSRPRRGKLSLCLGQSSAR